MANLEQIKERLLNGELFIFPEAVFKHEIREAESAEDIRKWFHLERIENEEDASFYRNKIGTPITIREQEKFGFGERLSIKSFGKKYIKAETYVLTRKVKFKINLEEIIFKNDFKK